VLEAILLLPQCVFIAWYFVKHRDNLTSNFTFTYAEFWPGSVLEARIFRPTRSWEDNIEMDLREEVVMTGLVLLVFSFLVLLPEKSPYGDRGKE
jgi:hypothetical protein